MSDSQTSREFTSSRYNPVRKLTEHPIPDSNDGLDKLRRSNPTFNFGESNDDPEYLTRDEIIDAWTTVLGETDTYKIFTVDFIGFESQVIIWNSVSSTGLRVESSEGQFYAIARVIANALENGNFEPSECSDNGNGELPVTGVDSHPLLVPENEIGDFVKSDEKLFRMFGNEDPHPDTLYINGRNEIASFHDWEVFTVKAKQYEDELFVWNTALGTGVKFDTSTTVGVNLLRGFASVFNSWQRTGDGNCPKCLGELETKSYPHGTSTACTECDFTQ